MLAEVNDDQTLALVLLTRRFSVLIDAGVSLMRSLIVLQEETPSPYQEALREIAEKIEQGDSLALAMSARPELFSNLYLAMIRAGEVGGVLDETMGYLADLLEEYWKYSNLLNVQWPGRSLHCPSSDPLPADLGEMSYDRRLIVLMLFCRTVGLLLSSGVPLLHTMDTAAFILPERQRGEWLERREVIRNGERTLGVTFLPALVNQIFAIGEQTGTLDTAALKVADLFKRELECRHAGMPAVK